MSQRKLYVIDYCEGREVAGYIDVNRPPKGSPAKVILEFTVVTNSERELESVVGLLARQSIQFN